MSFMNDDDKDAQLTRTFLSASENEAANIKLAMSNIPAPFSGGQQFIPPIMKAPNSIIPTSNSVDKKTVFENPKELQATIKDNGKIHNDFRGILKWQQPVKVDDPPDERTEHALVNLTKERTFNTPFLNQLKNRIIVSQISIDTKFRKNYFSTQPSDFVVNLTNPLKNVISMRLSSMEIPNVQHVISANNGTNGFTISKNGLVQEATIASGNYEYWLLGTQLNDLSGGGMTKTGIECSINIDEKSMRTTITNAQANDMTHFELDFTNPVDSNSPPMKTLGWLLGFRNRKYEGSHIYQSEAAVDLAGSKYFFLAINDFNPCVHDVVTVLYENSFLQDNILARIPMREGKGVVLFDDCTDKITKKRHYFGPVNVDKLHIKLMDEYGMPIDLLGMDYSFALEFQILYEK